MTVVGNRKIVEILDWLNSKKFKYSINALRTDALHGVYHLEINNKEEELLTRLTWGIT